MTTPISQEDAYELFEICKKTKIPLLQYKNYNNGKTSKRMGRAQSFGEHRAVLLGYVYPRFKPRCDGPKLSSFSVKNQELYECLLKISNKYFPEHKFQSIQLNQNVVCPPHLDRKNTGASMIFAVGDYVGCNLQIEHDDYILEADIKNRILEFDGSKHRHWNTPLVSGTKYSFVFYT